MSPPRRVPSRRATDKDGKASESVTKGKIERYAGSFSMKPGQSPPKRLKPLTHVRPQGIGETPKIIYKGRRRTDVK
ncbi:MAG: hypothetical protein ABIH20_02910 [Candidatus Diapherotrites archaeon]